MTETWKAIAGFEGLYEVSDLGRVKSLKYGREKIMKPRKNNWGYLQISLCKDGHKKRKLVHRLVAEAFIPNPLGLETVNHKDETKTNNTANNLEWMSMGDNVAYSQPHLAKRRVQMLDKSTGELLDTFPSTHDAERVTGIAQTHISQCCKGKLKSAGGFLWQYS